MSEQAKSDTQSTEPKEKPFYTRPKFIMGAFVTVVLLVLVLQNMGPATISIFFWKASVPAAIVYVLCAIIGFGAAKITARPRKDKPKGS